MEGHLFEDQLVECFRCSGVFPRRDLCAIEEIPGYRWPRYCRHCAEEIRLAYRRRCALCDSEYLARSPADGDGLCPACCSEERLRELARVRYHLARARSLHLPATLTLAQWLAALKHFDNRCAYCGAPFSDLDHFLPLAHGGGTTAANCVPACSACNSAKSAAHPDSLADAIKGPGSLQRVRIYLLRVA